MVPVRVALLLQLAVAVVVLGSVVLHLYATYRQTSTNLADRVAGTVQAQTVSIANHWENIEQTLDRVAVGLNAMAALSGLNAGDTLDTLRHFQSLMPGAVDLLLVREDGSVVAASAALASKTQLAQHCPTLAANREVITRQQWWTMPPGAASQRCPPAGTLVFSLNHPGFLQLNQGHLWLLFEENHFTHELKGALPPDLPNHRYRLWWRGQTALASGGQTPDGHPPAAFPPALAQGALPELLVNDHWTDPATGERLTVVSQQVQGTGLRVQVVYNTHSATMPRFQPYLLPWAGAALLFVLFWGLVATLTLRMVFRYQKAMLKNEERFERSLDYARVGVWEWDFATGHMRWSSHVSAFFGVPTDQVTGTTSDFMDRVHPDDRPKVESAIARCVKDKVVYSQEYRVLDGADRVRWVHSHGDVQRDAQGRAIRMFGVMQDATERVLIATQLAEAANHTQVILDNVVDAIITIDEHGSVQSFNSAASRIFGYTLDEVKGQNVKVLMPEPYRSEHDGYIDAHKRTGVNRIIGIGREVVGLHKSGQEFPINLAVSGVFRDGKRLYIGLIRDITQQRKAEAEIQHLAFFDHLTNLPNRRLLQDRIQRTLLSCERSGHVAALAMLDLDDFKTLNDTRGHEAGDQLLVELGQRLQHAVREGDTVARLGGDEFVVLLDNLGPDRATAAVHAETAIRKVLAVFQAPFHPQGREHRTSASLGLTLFGDHPNTPDSLLGQTDMAMYQAKASGRNTYRFFDTELQVSLNARASLERDLLQGLTDRAFHLVYQPQVDEHGKTTGFEALIRWRHAVRGAVSPAQFIPLAEQTGFIQPLGHWVLQTACEKLVTWATEPHTSALTLAINVSAHQFRSPDFVKEVLDTLSATGADPSRLKLELTESMLADDIDSLIDKMSALQTHGVQFSLDDFGTGYSSLSYLKRLPLDQLKIDQSFVRDLLTDTNDAAIVRAIITLGQSLGLAVIAEGVETADQRAYLAHSGCVQYQGYLFGRPLDDGALSAYLDQL